MTFDKPIAVVGGATGMIGDPSGKSQERNLLSKADLEHNVAAIREQNLEVSAGAIGGPPTPEGSVMQVSINAQGRLASPEAFGEIVLKSHGPELTRLKDVARIELGAQTYATSARLNGKPAAGIGVRSGSDAPDGRAAPGVPIRGQPDAARAPASGGS